jgi:hypothetical protein
MKKSMRIPAAALAGCIALTVGLGAATAGASTTALTSFVRHRDQCLRDVDHRITGLQLTQYRVDISNHLTPDQKTSVTSNIQPTIDELNGTYRPAILAATTPAQLSTACSSVFVNLRIWVVFLPQVTYTATLDGLGNWHDSLQSKVTSLGAFGTDVSALQSQLDDAAAKIHDASALTVSITPASFNADPSGTIAEWNHVHDDVIAAFIDLVHVYQAVNHPAPDA